MVLNVSSSSTWIQEKSSSWIHRMMFYILKCGTVPKHVAFIMDGNRRFANKLCVQTIEGHEKGFGKLTETLSWCLDMDICEVTVYAFSIQNFKRSKGEVDNLMDLAREKFKTLIGEWRILQDHGVCVRIIGNLNLLPTDLLILMLIAMLLTKHNKKAFLNIAFPYIGRDEMVNTAGPIIEELQDGNLTENDISEDLFEKCLYTYQSPIPDLVIRTSGEHRISDFLSWQSANSYIYFVNVLWPEFSAWHLIQAVFYYQHFVNRLEAASCNTNSTSNNKTSDVFANTLHEKRMQTILDTSKERGEPIDMEKLISFSREELFEYYKQKFIPEVKT